MENLYNAISSGIHSTYDIELLFVSNDAENDDLLNSVFATGLTPLCLACKLNRADLVSLLLRKGARPNVHCNFLKKYPLHFACDHSAGNLDIVNMLLASGAEPSVQDEDGNSALHLACTESNVAVVSLLLDAGADVNKTDVDGETPLVRACFAKSVELIDILLKAGCDPNSPNGYPVEIVVRAPSLEGLKLLIAAGARVTSNTYLSFASEHDYLDMMKILRNYGADVNDTGRLGLSALHHACLSQGASSDAVHLLLQWGSDPKLITNTGDTPLHLACRTFALDKVRLLLMYGADVNQTDGTNTSPLVVALTTRREPREDHHDASYITLIQLLFAAGAKLPLSVFERIKALIVYVQSSATDKQELFQLLTKHTSEPLSLQCQCRAAIRQKIQGNIDQGVFELPLPNAIIKFMQFSDIPDCVYRQ